MLDHTTPTTGASRASGPEDHIGFTKAESAILDRARLILARHARATTAIQSWSRLGDYLALSAAKERTEVLRVLYLDRKNKLIQDKVMATGTVDHTPVYAREIIRTAILLDASAIIMCHNHPSGDPTTSGSDVRITKQVQNACKAVSIDLHDHVIVGHGREHNAYSMRSAGLMSHD